MGAHAGPVLDASVYSLWDKIIYHYDLSLDVCTNDMYKMNTIDNTAGYDSFARVYDLSGNGYHLLQSTKTLQLVVDYNRYTKYNGKKISRSISYQSFIVDGETTQRYMQPATSADARLEFGNWTCYVVNQFDGHFRYDPSIAESNHTRYQLIRPLGNIDNNAEWNVDNGSGVLWHWRNDNAAPNGTSLTFRGYGYGNHYSLPEATGVSFDINQTLTKVYDTSTYGVPAGKGASNVDRTRELIISTMRVTKGVEARIYNNHAQANNVDTSIEDVSTMTHTRPPVRLLGGRIAEVLMFSEAHSDDTRLRIHQFLAKKWSIKLNQL